MIPHETSQTLIDIGFSNTLLKALRNFQKDIVLRHTNENERETIK
tara:strand:+ start:150 stop:284 length:135 start_codon:yes stop_codon:yes gene_type:complete